MRELIKVGPASKLVGCSTTTIIRWCNEGFIEHEVKKAGLSKRYRVVKASLLKYWEKRKQDFDDQIIK